MKLKKMKNSDNAVVGIVAAFLIIGLFIAVLSVVQTQYVPKWMKEKESDHMNVLADQFAQLNYAINTHVFNEKANIPISTTITLGNKELPYLMSVRAFGQLNIINDGCIISINGTPNLNISIGTIKYNSYNNYYIDQNYIYECGGLILSQYSGNALTIDPFFTCNFLDNFEINFTTVNITTIGNKDTSLVGYGPTPIRTEYKSSDKTFIDNISYINITTNYITSWKNFINSSLINQNFVYGTNYIIEIIDNKLIVHFVGTDKVLMNLNEVDIGAQIGHGIIKERK